MRRKRDAPLDAPVRYCIKWPMHGRERCRLHGGTSLRGTAHPRWRGKGHAASMPTRLADRYRTALRDPELVSLRRQIAKVDALIEAEWARLLARGTADVPALRAAYLAMRAAISQGDTDGANAAMARLGAGLEAAHATETSKRALLRLVDQSRKLVEAEAKRLLQAQQVLTLEEVMAFVGALGAAVQRKVSNPAEVAAVLEEFERLSTVPNRHAIAELRRRLLPEATAAGGAREELLRMLAEMGARIEE